MYNFVALVQSYECESTLYTLLLNNISILDVIYYYCLVGKFIGNTVIQFVLLLWKLQLKNVQFS